MVLSALHALAGSAQDALLAVHLHAAPGGGGTSTSVSRPGALLDLLLLLMEDAITTAGAAGNGAVPAFGAGGSGLAAAAGYSRGGVVRAGWEAAACAAALCTGHQAAQDAAAARGLLPVLAAFLAAEPPPARGGAGLSWGLVWPTGALGGSAALPAAVLEAGTGASGEGVREAILGVQSEVAACFRSFCMRAAHHAAVRASGVVPTLHKLATAGGCAGCSLSCRPVAGCPARLQGVLLSMRNRVA